MSDNIRIPRQWTGTSMRLRLIAHFADTAAFFEFVVSNIYYGISVIYYAPLSIP